MRVTAKGDGISFGGDENVLKLIVVLVYTLNILKATELHTLSGWIVWVVNYI